ncbi:MAG: PTS lactose/cellobiose transporter subunit IIA, partial [Fusobacteriaceae bacterium]|nr:PTS lactose/cellobiose transporter subunit IIA [Fusobacteriaceae bacterium]
MDLEMAAMQIVGSAGESKSLCFEALAAAKKGDFDGADAKIAEARKVFLQAHEV